MLDLRIGGDNDDDGKAMMMIMSANYQDPKICDDSAGEIITSS